MWLFFGVQSFEVKTGWNSGYRLRAFEETGWERWVVVGRKSPIQRDWLQLAQEGAAEAQEAVEGRCYHHAHAMKIHHDVA